MLVVLDTNVVLRAVSKKSRFADILDNLLLQSYRLAVSTEILLEYEEKIILFYGGGVAQNFLNFLTVMPNVEKVEPFFQLRLIQADYDDNKFVDCAFASNAHYIVTDDKHFNILKTIGFPQIPCISAEDFQKLLLS